MKNNDTPKKKLNWLDEIYAPYDWYEERRDELLDRYEELYRDYTKALVRAEYESLSEAIERFPDSSATRKSFRRSLIMYRSAARSCNFFKEDK